MHKLTSLLIFILSAEAFSQSCGDISIEINSSIEPYIMGAEEVGQGHLFDSSEDMILQITDHNDGVVYWYDYLDPLLSPLDSLPYGRIIATSSSPDDHYYASPSILKTSTGRVIASHDHYGPSAPSNTSVYYSDNIDTTEFVKSQEITGMVWASLFEYDGDIYLLGTSSHSAASLMISKSTDDGETWSTSTQVMAPPVGYDGWHNAPNNVVIKNGYLVFPLDLEIPSTGWAARFATTVVFADVTDLMDPLNWSKSNVVTFDVNDFADTGIYSSAAAYNQPSSGQPQKGFLESSLVELDDGTLRVFKRLEQSSSSNHAVYLDMVPGLTMPDYTLSATHNFIDMPGGHIKFQIKNVDGVLWTVANFNKYKFFPNNRMEAFLISSDDDGETWSVHEKVLGWERTINWQDDIPQLGVQYSSIDVDGDDLIIATRTADFYADNFHNSNSMTISRIEDFELSPKESFVSGGLVIDDNSSRLESVDGISIIDDQSDSYNSPYNTDENLEWDGGLDFTGGGHLIARHDKSLNPDNGMTACAVVEDLQSTSGGRILSKADGTLSDISATGWALYRNGLLIGSTYANYSDATINSDYIICSTFDADTNRVSDYLNDQLRVPNSVVRGTWNGSSYQLDTPYAGGNIGDLNIGKRSGSSHIPFTSKVLGIYVYPEYKDSTAMQALIADLNCQHSIFSGSVCP